MRPQTVLLLLTVITPYIFFSACNDPVKQDSVSTIGENINRVRKDTATILSHVAIAPSHNVVKDCIVSGWTYWLSTDEMSCYHNLNADLSVPYSDFVKPEVTYTHYNPFIDTRTEGVWFVSRKAH